MMGLVVVDLGWVDFNLNYPALQPIQPNSHLPRHNRAGSGMTLINPTQSTTTIPTLYCQQISAERQMKVETMGGGGSGGRNNGAMDSSSCMECLDWPFEGEEGSLAHSLICPDESLVQVNIKNIQQF